MKKKNQGYTLVELIVTIAILALAGIGIGTIVSQALKTYRVANAEVDLQQESQLAGNQLMNLVIDANDGVSTESGKLNIYHYDEAKDVRNKTVIAYQDTDGTLTYTRYEADGTAGGWLPVAGEMEECLAEYVSGFSVELLDAKGKRLIATGDYGDTKVRQVKMHILYELDNESYDFEQTVTLRNGVLASSIVQADSEENPSESTETESTESTENTETENTETKANQVRIYLTDSLGTRYDVSATLTGGTWYGDTWYVGRRYQLHIETYDEASDSYQETSWGDEVRAGHLYAFTNNSGNTISNKDTYMEDGYLTIRSGRNVDRKTYSLTIRYNGSGENPKENTEYEAVFTITTE